MLNLPIGLKLKLCFYVLMSFKLDFDMTSMNSLDLEINNVIKSLI